MVLSSRPVTPKSSLSTSVFYSPWIPYSYRLLIIQPLLLAVSHQYCLDGLWGFPCSLWFLKFKPKALICLVAMAWVWYSTSHTSRWGSCGGGDLCSGNDGNEGGARARWGGREWTRIMTSPSSVSLQWSNFFPLVLNSLRIYNTTRPSL